MMNFPSSFTLFLLLTLLTITTTSNAGEAPSPQPAIPPEKLALLNKACETTPLYKDMCISALGLYPESEVKDVPGLARYAIDMVAKRAEMTQKQIEDMDAKTDDPATKKKLKDCSEMYGDISDNLKESAQAMDKKAYDDVIASITAATNDVESCEDGFKEPPVVQSPLTDVNEMFTKFCSICLAITSSFDK